MQQVIDRSADTPERAEAVAYDTVMLRHGLADEDTILFALENQDKTGEFFVDHLCRTGQVDQGRLLEELAAEFGYPSIDLGSISIPRETGTLITEADARRYSIIPFRLDQEGKEVFLATLNPALREIADRIEELLPNLTTRLYVCLPDQLRTAIDSIYAPAQAAECEPPAVENHVVTRKSRGSVMLVTSYPPSDRLLSRGLAEDGWDVFVMNSVEESLEVIRNRPLDQILIRVEPGADYPELLRECAAICPEVLIRTYESIGDITAATDHRSCRKLLADAMGLLRQTALAESEAPQSSKATELCQAIAEKIGLEQQKQMILDSCAHLYDLHDFFLGELPESGDPTKRFRMIASGLESMDYSGDVVSVLRRLYDDSSDPRDSQAVVAGVLTLVDFCLERWPEVPFLDEAAFAALRKTVSDQIGTLFRDDVADALLDVIRSHVVPARSGEEACCVLMLCPPGIQDESSQMLNHSGCDVIVKNTVHEFVTSYRQDQPDILILAIPGSPELVTHRLNNLIARGVIFDQIPTLVLLGQRIMSDLADLYHQGIEDILPLENCLELLTVKVERIRQRLTTERDHRRKLIQGLGTHGSLSDMNVIDLLQAMRSSEKTALISVTGLREQLNVYISGGNLIYAESGELEGPEAVFNAIRWRQGVWSIEPISPEDLPEPNNTRSIDAILIEGCTLMDETNQQSLQADTDGPDEGSIDPDQFGIMPSLSEDTISRPE